MILSRVSSHWRRSRRFNISRSMRSPRFSVAPFSLAEWPSPLSSSSLGPSWSSSSSPMPASSSLSSSRNTCSNSGICSSGLASPNIRIYRDSSGEGENTSHTNAVSHWPSVKCRCGACTEFDSRMVGAVQQIWRRFAWSLFRDRRLYRR